MKPKLLYQLNKIVNHQLHLKWEDENDMAIVY